MHSLVCVAVVGVTGSASIRGASQASSAVGVFSHQGSARIQAPSLIMPAIPIEPLCPLPKQKMQRLGGEAKEHDSHVSLNKLDKDVQGYTKALELLAKEPALQKEVNLGKRVGLYRLSRELGSGNFSKVKLGMHVLTKEKVAVKIMERSKMDQKAIRLLNREVVNMEEMHHPNIIRLFEVVETLSKIYLILEYARGGELYSYVMSKQYLPEREAARLYAQVCSAVIHMHGKGIIHRDIKSENVFFAGPGWVKLGDFGFSVQIDPGKTLKTFCGSPPYAAPELFKEKEYQGEYVDIWALGVLCYFLVTGMTPFRGDTVAELKRGILEGHFVCPEHVSAFCQHLIHGLLRMQPTERFNFAEIMDHYWLNRCRFPEADPFVPPYPNEEELKALPVAPIVFDRLTALGITPQMCKDASAKGAKNSVIGTYRVITFMCQREDAEKKGIRQPIPEHDEDDDGHRVGGAGGGGKRTDSKHATRLCTIL